MRRPPGGQMLLLLLSTLAILAPPRAQETAVPDLETRLDATPITFRLLETPVVKALEHLGQLAGATVIVHQDVDPETPVTFQGTDMPASRAFRWVVRLAGLEHMVREQTILVAAPGEIHRRRARLQVFDLRELLLQDQDHPGPHLGMAEPADGEAGGVMFGAVESGPALDPDALIELITSCIAPESWHQPAASIESQRGLLFVTNVPEVLEGIDVLLRDLRARVSKLVTLEAWALKVSAAVHRELVGDRVMLEPSACQQLLERAAAGLDAAILEHVQTTCRSGQRVSPATLAGREYLSDVDLEVAQGAAVVDPIVSQLLDGLVADLRPVVAASSTHTVVRVHLQLGKTSEPLRGLTYGAADRRPEGEEPISIELPVQDLVTQRVTARVPAGGALALGCTSPMAGGASAWQLVLLVRVTPRVPTEEEER